MPKKKLIILFMAVIFAGLISLLDAENYFNSFQLKAYDTLFYLRANLGLEHQKKAPIAIVEIDDRTFSDKAFKIPQILWHSYFAKVIEGLVDGEAKVIALDYLLPKELFDDIVPNYSRTWLKAFAYAKSKEVPVVNGFIETADHQIIPQARYIQIIGSEHFGFFNLTTDEDDFIRRQRLFYLSMKGDKKVYSFSYLIAQAFKQDLCIPADTVYIDYLHSDHPFPSCSFAEIYKKSLNEDVPFLRRHFLGKIVLIGETDSLSIDRHPTPLYYLKSQGNKRTPGLEIVAHTVNTLLGKRFFKETSFLLRLCIYFILALVVGLLTLFCSQKLLYLFLPSLIMAFGGTSLFAFANYCILPLVPGLAVIFFAQAGFFSYKHYILDKEKRKTRSIFQRFLPSKVVTQLLATKDIDSFRGENKRLCILFSDIRDFTGYSENKGPTEVVERLNEYFKAMSAVVFSGGGVVDKFLGDGLLAFFGAFNDQNNPSLSGVRAALKMFDELELLNKKWAEPFRMGIGLHTGEVKIGTIGSPDKMEYTVIGDAVNVAARLQEKTKALNENIIISEAVYEDLSGEVEAEEKETEEIRGRSPIRIYALKGLRRKS